MTFIGRVLFAAGLLALAAPRAEAGMFCAAREDFMLSAADLEAFAKDRRDAVETTSAICLRTGVSPPEPGLEIPKNYAARVEKACATILARDSGDALCIELGVWMGKSEIGGVVLLEAALGWKLDPWSWDGYGTPVWVLGKIGDARAATKIMETWKANLPVADKRQKRGWSLQAWAGWRKDAAEAIGKVGVAEHATFLREQAAATKDRYVKKACLDAAAVIDKRVTP